MGLAAIEHGIKIWKCLISSFKTCYGSLRDHLFILATLFTFFVVYRFLPSMFNYLISSSPILICTAVLLRILLSLGRSDIPQVESKRTHEISYLKSRTEIHDCLIGEKDEKLSVETKGGKLMEIKKKTAEKMCAPKAGKAKSSKEKKVSFLPIGDDGLIGRTMIEEKSKETHGVAHANREVIKDGSSDIGKDEIEAFKAEIDNPMDQFPDTHLNVFLDSSRDLSGKQFGNNDETSNFVSDLADDSSPDSSIAEMVPVLDELHPLLDSKPPRLSLKSTDEFDTDFERSDISNDGSNESEDIENQEEEEEEEETQGGEGDRTKAVVRWTEDDEKNLMDLGTSEMERNRRLENLIARRKARKILSKEAEKNLIDLDSNDPPLQIPTILTTRNNPFDLPYPSNEIEGLPPIPGSAPPVLVPRGNPFDLPYDPLEERPNLTKDSFHEEFMTILQKDMQFCRHESFSLGNSFLGGVKQETPKTRLSPFFGVKGMSSEETEYPTLQRKLGESSNSKSIYVPESDLLTSAADEDDRKKIIEKELTQESILISHIDQEKRDVNLDTDEMKGMEKELIDTSEAVKEMDNESSSSSLSGSNQEIFDMDSDEVQTKNLDPTMGDGIEGSANPMKSSQSLKDSDLASIITDRMDDNQPKEPIYDSSPSAIEKRTIEESLFCVDKGVVLTSTSPITSDLQVDVSDIGSPPMPVERTISLTNGESLLYNESDENETNSCNVVVEESELSSTNVTEISECDVVKVGISEANTESNDSISAPMESESVVEQVLVDSNIISSPVKESGQVPMNQVLSSSADPETLDGVHQSDSEEADRSGSSPSEKIQPLTEEFNIQPSSDSNYKEEPQELSVKNTKEANIINNVNEEEIDTDGDHDKLVEQEPSMKSMKEANIINNVNEEEINESKGKDDSKSIDDPEGDQDKLVEQEPSMKPTKEANIINNVNEEEINENEVKYDSKSIDDTEGDHDKLVEQEPSIKSTKEANIINNVNKQEINENVRKDDSKAIDNTEGDCNKLIEHKEHLVSLPEQMKTGFSSTDDVKASGVEAKILEASNPEEDKQIQEENFEKSIDIESTHEESMPKGNDETELSTQDPKNLIETS